MNQPMDKPRVMVTGGNGFIGRAAVTALLDSGADVIGTYRGDQKPELTHEKLSWAQADLTTRAGIEAVLSNHQPTHLLALAWYMGPGNQQALENFRWIQHSIDLLFEFSKAGGQRVVFCGSCMEYDWSEEKKLNETDTPLRPDSEYGAAKSALFTAYGPLCRKLELSAAWARPFFLYGPEENRRRLVADVIVSLLEGREALCTEGLQKRDFLHSGDVGRAMSELLLSDIEGPLNIGSGTATAVAEVVKEIGRQIGRPELLRLGARESRPGDPPLVEADTTKLHSTLNWQPRFDLNEGLADTIAWWRKELEKEGLK